MAMRLQEVHPSIVHFPLTLLPLSVGADLIGQMTGSRKLRAFAKMTMPLAAVSAAVAAAAGLVAQEEVNATGEAHDMLVTHRNMNLGLVATAAAMAVWRAKRDKPTPAYLALGLLGLASMTYTAYLGGHMVYEHGVGVMSAGGVRGASPELAPGTMTDAARVAGQDLRDAVRST
ncbi:MAG TPA: DUF2231 domain-containing protein [Gemmatimonadaceae bacterium]|nr:DUF2231 domain-containing protein [Gemmatimonadaceae bacterium]